MSYRFDAIGFLFCLIAIIIAGLTVFGVLKIGMFIVHLLG